MNNRKRKIVQAQKRARRDIHRILDAVLDINGLEASEEPYPTVFLRFWGHIGTVEVELCEDGWSDKKLSSERKAPVHRLPRDRELSLSEMADWLEKERERLA